MEEILNLMSNLSKSQKIKWSIARKFDVMVINRYDFLNQRQKSHNHSSECKVHSEHKMLLPRVIIESKSLLFLSLLPLLQ